MEENNRTIRDYWDIVKRWKYYFIIPCVAILIGATLLATLLPAIYRSEGKILVESQQIPTDFVQSTVTSYAEERIEVIKQIVMTRENLLKIIEDYNLYEEQRAAAPISHIIGRMQKNIYVEIISGEIGGAMNRRRGAPSITFTVAFEHPDPSIAQSVTNKLVTLFLADNLKTRTERASETTTFLSKEAEKLKKELDRIESQVAEYKQQYKDSLPENLELNIQILEQAKSNLVEIERDIKSEKEQKVYLEVELASLQSSIPANNTEALTPTQQLALLQSRYNELIATYAPAHPDVRKLKRQIDELQANIESKSGSSSSVTASSNPTMMLVQAQISSSKSKIDSLEKDRQKIKERIALLEDRILTTPQVERGFKILDRDYENIKEKYEELKEKESAARLSQSMEEQSKAERFTILEPPNLPIEPVKPPRKKIGLLGIVLALGGGLGMVLLRDQMDTSIRGSRHLTKVIKEVPLVTIGFIDTTKNKTGLYRYTKATTT